MKNIKMVHYKETFSSKFSKEQIFDMVLDVEKYPEFLPWCSGCRIHSKNEDQIIAELLIRFERFSESYTSTVTFERPNFINVIQTSGPFKQLLNKWKFESVEDGTTIINFEIEFQFKSKIIDKLIGSVFEKATRKITSSFISRADFLYIKPFNL